MPVSSDTTMTIASVSSVSPERRAVAQAEGAVEILAAG